MKQRNRRSRPETKYARSLVRHSSQASHRNLLGLGHLVCGIGLHFLRPAIEDDVDLGGFEAGDLEVEVELEPYPASCFFNALLVLLSHKAASCGRGSEA